ncbi:Uncharacterised protein [Legionella beliardensis]|uniref:Uncharacterized protein n=1 Tax=Legionella beliardensis TaxID=91822 RepID=A0A378I3F3_9GAMM|nr:hypothetical protein [Legionella beliardensis]STX29231.1 Uncharacterised protein [Legionella beliardensis]
MSKISIYVNIPGKQSTELRTYKISKKAMFNIAEIVNQHARPADSDIHSEESHIIIDGKHYEFDKQNIHYYEEIKSELLKLEKGKSVDLEEDDGLVETVEDQKKIIEISANKKEVISEPSFTVQSIIDTVQEKLAQFSQLNDANYREKINISKRLPAVLADFYREIEDLRKVIPGPKLDLSSYRGNGRQEQLISKKQELERQLQSVDAILATLSNAKSTHLQIAFSRSKDDLGNFDLKKLNKHYVALTKTLEQLNDALDLHFQQIKTELEIIEEKKEEEKFENSIVIRTWYGSENDEEDTRQIMGIPTDGHTTVELYKNKNERIYLGFYVVPDRQDQSLVKQAFKKAGLPSPTVGKGYFVDLGYDQSLVGKDKKFRRCETVVVKCDRPGAELDFNAAYEWARRTKAKYPSKGKGSKKIQIIDDYNFYNKNCASFGIEALRQAGAESVLKYSGSTLASLDTPTGVRKYAQSLEKTLAERAKIYAEENKILADGSKTLQEKYSYYIKFAIARLELVKTADPELQTALDSLIGQLYNAADEIAKLPDTEVKGYIDELFVNLHGVINHFIVQDTHADCSEIIETLKNLSSLMPPQDKLFINVITSSIVNNLHSYNSRHVNGEFGDFKITYLDMNNKVSSVAYDSDMSLFAKTLQIRTTLYQLNELYQAEREGYKDKEKSYKKKEDREKLKAHFTNLTDYYRAAHEQLVNTLATLRNEIYFKPGALEINNAHLDNLMKLFLPANIQIAQQLSVPNLLQNAKSENTWADASNLPRLKDNDRTNILRGKGEASKPNILAFWNWPKRHQHFEFEHRVKVYQIVNNDQLHWKAKLQLIDNLVAENKPGLLKVWRQDERKRYDNLKAQASFICLLEAFTEGKLSEANFAVEIEKIIPDIEESKRPALTQFKKDFLDGYQVLVNKESKDNANSQAQQHKPYTYKNMLGELLKTTANTSLSRGDMFEDLGMAIYADRQYSRLNPQLTKRKESQAPKPDPTPEEQVQIEVGLWQLMG